jgi:TolA-binding protein
MKSDPAKAAEVFRQIIERFPHSDRASEAELLLAKALTEANQADKALQVYQQILQRQPSGSTMFSIMHQTARLHQSAGHTDEAVHLLQRIATDANEYEHLDAVLYEWGWALADLDRNEEADAVFGDLARRFPDSDYRGHALYRLAQRAARDQKFDDARQLLEELIGQNCEARILVPALYLKGQTEANAGNWAAVVPPMRRVLDNFPDSDLAVPARYWVAESHFRLGDYDRADQLFNSLQLETEDREDAWLAMVPLRRAQILAHRGNWREARRSAESILARHPQFVQRFEVDYLLGRCYVAEADFERARESFEAVIRSPAGGRTETAAMAQWMIGESYLQQKNYAEAIKAYHRVEVLFPFPRWQAAALLQAGKCHELLGQWGESIGLYDQLIKEYPHTQFVDDASQRIRVSRQRQLEASAQR